MAKATSIKEALARFERESGYVAADCEKVRMGHFGQRSSGLCFPRVMLIIVRRWTVQLRHRLSRRWMRASALLKHAGRHDRYHTLIWTLAGGSM